MLTQSVRLTALTLVHSTTEYCAPTWCRSAHTRLIDSTINDALRIVTGCLRPTSTDNLLVVASIQPAGLRREGETLALSRPALESQHLLLPKLTPSFIGTQRRLKSTHPCVLAAQDLLKTSNDFNISVAHQLDHPWNKEWKDNIARVHIYITDISPTRLEPSY